MRDSTRKFYVRMIFFSTLVYESLWNELATCRWAVIKDEDVYQKMLKYTSLSTLGTSHDTQLRTLKLLNTILDGEGGDIFKFGYKTMGNRWIRLRDTLSMSKRFSLQEIAPQYCFFFQRVRNPSPGTYLLFFEWRFLIYFFSYWFLRYYIHGYRIGK